MNGRTDHRAEVARLRAEIARRRRAGKSFDQEALELAVLLDEVAQIRGGVKMAPVQRIKNLR